MTRNATLIFSSCVALLALASCAGIWSTPRSGPTAEQAAQNRARPYLEGMAALERYCASTDMENEHSRTVQSKIAELEVATSQFSVVRMHDYELEVRERHTSLGFAFAEEAMRKGALDSADRVYRRMVEFYVGNAYSGIRDRARIGIDDLRARRAAASPSR